MMINGKDVAAFYSSHSDSQIGTIIQTLEIFGLHRELELYLKNGLRKKTYKPEPVDTLVSRLQPISSRCPSCGGSMKGTKHVSCAGRTWYEECNMCTYYREEFGGR